ncbi:MAG: hybrid sensor histidine kinase/response regulator [Vicinamibacterales bacterium]
MDDEAAVIDALASVLRRRFDVVVASSGPAGIEALLNEGPFAVVISDFQMPGMSGGEFLAQASVVAPAAVRVLLTGHASLAAAMTAVNEGHVYRLLTKPVPTAQLVEAIEAAADQAREADADRELLTRRVEAFSRHLVRADRLAKDAQLSRAATMRLEILVSELCQLAGRLAGQAAATGPFDRGDAQRLSTLAADIKGCAAQMCRTEVNNMAEGRDTELATAIAATVQELQTADLCSDSEIRISVPGAPVVRMQHVDLRQLLRNVIINAIEAANAAAAVDGRAPRVAVDVMTDTETATVVVSDNGAGIPPVSAALIFEPYFTTKPSGGVGLFAARQIVGRSGGTLTVASTPGRGAAFTIRVPLATPA